MAQIQISVMPATLERELPSVIPTKPKLLTKITFPQIKFLAMIM